MGFEILDSGICLGRKTWQLLFFLEGGGGLIYVGIFFAYSKKSDVTLHNVIDET